MKIKSLGLKVSLIVAFMIAITVGTIVYIVSIQSGNLVSGLSKSKAVASNLALSKELNRLQDEALVHSKAIF